MSIIKNNKNYGTKVMVEKIEPSPFTPYLTATYMVYEPSNSFKILDSTSNIAGWRFKGDTTWETTSTTIEVTGYGLIEIEFDLTDNTTISSYQFQYNNNLVKVEIPSTITTIGDWAFAWTKLSNLFDLSNVTNLGMGAFYSNNISGLDYTINNNVSRSGWDSKCMANMWNKFVNKIYVNGTVYCTLANVPNNSNIDFSNGIDGLPIYKWYILLDSKTLDSLKFPATLTNITGRAFSNCTITDIYFYGTTPPVSDDYDNEGIWYGSNITNIYVPAEALTAYQNSPAFADVVSKIQAMP